MRQHDALKSLRDDAETEHRAEADRADTALLDDLATARRARAAA